jgi:hypothetical protein
MRLGARRAAAPTELALVMLQETPSVSCPAFVLRVGIVDTPGLPHCCGGMLRGFGISHSERPETSRHREKTPHKEETQDGVPRSMS